MKLLEQRIQSDAVVLDGDILKVDMFLNHQIDVTLIKELGKELYTSFSAYPITKILTVESSGIPIACAAAELFNVPVVFAKKGQHSNIGSNVFSTQVFSFTKGKSYQINISKDYLLSSDNILIIDDFLANGEAVLGLKRIIDEARANLLGVGIAIEKGFQGGGEKIRKLGVPLLSLAVIESMSDGNIVFRLNNCKE